MIRFFLVGDRRLTSLPLVLFDLDDAVVDVVFVFLLIAIAVEAVESVEAVAVEAVESVEAVETVEEVADVVDESMELTNENDLCVSFANKDIYLYTRIHTHM